VTRQGRPEVAVGAVAVRDGALLLVRRATEPGRGLWSLPGGRVEPGEAVTDAVERELLEETGLRGRCGDLVGWAERRGDDHHFVILDFAAVVEDPSPPRAGTDAAAARWVETSDVPGLDLVDGLAEFLRAHGVLRS
jgi:8-oxo-dGTP diphosphatase